MLQQNLIYKIGSDPTVQFCYQASCIRPQPKILLSKSLTPIEPGRVRFGSEGKFRSPSKNGEVRGSRLLRKEVLVIAKRPRRFALLSARGAGSCASEVGASEWVRLCVYVSVCVPGQASDHRAGAWHPLHPVC